MKIKYFLSCLNIILWSHYCPCLAQNVLLDSLQLSKQKVFTNLTEAIKTPEQVYILDLNSQELKIFPQKITQLAKLQKLILHSNKIKAIPSEIHQLANLQFLDAYNNQIAQLPDSFALLQNLTYLDLGKNNLREIPKSVLQLPKIKFLFLYANPLKQISADICQKNSLHTLRLGSTKIKKLPENMGDLSSLEELYLPDNQVKKLPTSFLKLNNLRRVILENNRFRYIPNALYQLPKLEYVSLWNRNFTQKSITQLENTTSKPRVELFKRYSGVFTGISLEYQQGSQSLVGLSLSKGYLKDILGMGFQVGANYNFREEMWGLQATGWLNGLVHLGFGAIYYQKDAKNSFGICPAIGWGIRKTSIAYGYNILFKPLDGANTHHITLRYILSITP